MRSHFQMFATYNAWANRELYAAAAALTPEELNRNTGAFFGPLIRTLNHILVADRVWLNRLTGEGMLPTALDQVLHTDLADLRQAREVEDARFVALMDTLDDERLAASFSFTPVGKTEPVITQHVASTLAHVFNHQTHHRGQAHATLTALGKPSVTLDLVYFLRSEGRQWL